MFVIKPSDIPVSGIHSDLEDTLEAHCDRHIQQAARHGQWPARITHLRMVMPEEVIDRVADRYRAAGWKVLVSRGAAHYMTGAAHYMTIDHPDRPQ